MKIELTRNKYAIVDDEDFDYLNQFKWHYDNNYVARRDNKLKKKIYMHRVIMNPQDKLQVDHINGNCLDNRKCNLRVCTQTQNQGNGKIRKDNTSGIKGVSWYKSSKKWVTKIGINGKLKHLGYFDNKLEAKKVYDKAAKKHFGKFYSDGIERKDY